MTSHNLYVTPKKVESLEECYFYHTLEVPGHGVIKGDVDLRSGVEDYLGKTKFKGKRVLEVGTASGYLCFYMESRGADVVAYDLTPGLPWDFVPHSGDHSKEQELRERGDETISKLNNAYWFCHDAMKSKAKVCYGDIYNIPTDIGPVDISTLCSVLLHVRDPFMAIQNACRLTKETVIISECFSGSRRDIWQRYLGKSIPVMFFQPKADDVKTHRTWWHLTPALITRFIGVLGFGNADVSYSSQMIYGKKVPTFTVVGHRTKPMKKIVC